MIHAIIFIMSLSALTIMMFERPSELIFCLTLLIFFGNLFIGLIRKKIVA